MCVSTICLGDRHILFCPMDSYRKLKHIIFPVEFLMKTSHVFWPKKNNVLRGYNLTLHRMAVQDYICPPLAIWYFVADRQPMFSTKCWHIKLLVFLRLSKQVFLIWTCFISSSHFFQIWSISARENTEINSLKQNWDMLCHDTFIFLYCLCFGQALFC